MFRAGLLLFAVACTSASAPPAPTPAPLVPSVAPPPPIVTPEKPPSAPPLSAWTGVTTRRRVFAVGEIAAIDPSDESRARRVRAGPTRGRQWLRFGDAVRFAPGERTTARFTMVDSAGNACVTSAIRTGFVAAQVYDELDTAPLESAPFRDAFELDPCGDIASDPAWFAIEGEHEVRAIEPGTLDVDGVRHALPALFTPAINIVEWICPA